jgi:hypothetical protein
VRLVNPLYTEARAKHMDIITNTYVAQPTSGKATLYLEDAVSGAESTLITGLLTTLTGSANVAALQHSLTAASATTAAANGTYYRKSAHTAPTGSVAYTNCWVKSGDDDCVLVSPDSTRAGAAQTRWAIKQEGVGELYFHASTVGYIEPPTVTAWQVGAAGTGTVPSVVETFA